MNVLLSDRADVSRTALRTALSAESNISNMYPIAHFSSSPLEPAFVLT